MKYTIEGFNQAKAVELELCVADLIILRWFVDFAGTERMVKRLINEKEYYWVKYEGILEDLPILSITKDTLYRRLKGLVEKEVLEHITVKEAGTFSFYRLGKNYLALIADTPTYLSEKNPTGYGKKSDRGTEKNPYQKTNLLNNTKKQKNNHLSEINGEQAPLEKRNSKEVTIDEIYKDPKNEKILEALRLYHNWYRDSKLGYKASSVAKWANLLSEYSKDDPLVAMEIAKQSIENGWRNIFPLKKSKKYDDGSKMKPFNMDDVARDENGEVKVW